MGWDRNNWSRALDFWERHTRLAPSGLESLEVGAGGAHGNLSLWLAAQGFRVVCSGLEEPSDSVRSRHVEYGVAQAVRYESIDVLDLPYTAAFHVVAFKSLLGAFGMADGDPVAMQRAAVLNMWRALRPGGELWFVEGALGSRVHDALRRRFGWGRAGWCYVPLYRIDALLSPFTHVDVAAFGVLGLLGRTERQRDVLAAVDRTACESLVPRDRRHIVAGVARKGPVG
ncbi:hypothetical protein AB0D86_08290 [Streptomyces sp. NPDC048324]|uniref:class I SAM-dependent methyltransferase n=1 Tax=Streptomyces sp. NPDC048324 TaxID=3157205 RepID=UPI00344A3C1C